MSDPDRRELRIETTVANWWEILEAAEGSPTCPDQLTEALREILQLASQRCHRGATAWPGLIATLHPLDDDGTGIFPGLEAE